MSKINNYKFTEEWFSESIKSQWSSIFEDYKKKGGPSIRSVLEVGCYEGRASTWICENLLKGSGRLDVVDLFTGTPCESGMAHSRSLSASTPSSIKDSFDHNLSFFPNIDLHVHKGLSQEILPTLAYSLPAHLYDFIYIDGSHSSPDTFVDAFYADKLLKKGGVLIFDDFLWKDPTLPLPIDSPGAAISFYAHLYGHKYTLLNQGYQVALRKN